MKEMEIKEGMKLCEFCFDKVIEIRDGDEYEMELGHDVLESVEGWLYNMLEKVRGEL